MVSDGLFVNYRRLKANGLSSPGSERRQVEPWASGQGDPCFQNQGGIYIRVGLETAVATTEHFLARSISALGMTASTALLRGVTRVHFDQRNACSPAFVSQKGFQLRESPVIQFRPHHPIQTVSSLTDALQPLDRECLLSVECHADQGFRDTVIHVTDKTRFFATALCHPLPRRARFLRLKFLTQAAAAFADTFHRFACVAVAFAVGGDVDDAEVYADHTFGYERFGLCHGDRAGEVEGSVPQEQVGLPLLALQQSFLL